MTLKSFKVCLIASVFLFVSGCENQIQVTCEYMSDGSCASNEIDYDPTLAERSVLIIGIDGFRADAMTESSSIFMGCRKQSVSIFLTRMLRTILSADLIGLASFLGCIAQTPSGRQ